MFVGLVEGTGASCRAIPMPLSAIVTAVMLPTPREAPFPFVRRSAAVKGAFGGSIDVEAYLSAVDEMVSDATNGIFAVSQIAAVGGKILTNDPNSETTSYPLRDASYIMGLNLFYANVINPGAEVRARQHQETRWPSVVVSPHELALHLVHVGEREDRGGVAALLRQPRHVRHTASGQDRL
eukprot:Sspe_Gene.2307::Locus_760_Transcript_1_1_Confidence_1.000_Length_1536::g.2307::m.2307